MNLIKSSVILSDHHKDFIETMVLNDSFPWFKAPYQTENPVDPRVAARVVNSPFFSHVLMRRSETQGQEGHTNSQYYRHFKDIFTGWCEMNNVTVNTIYRACVNLVYPAPGEFSVPHQDHDWPHKNWIMYLNDSRAHTVLFNDEYQIIQWIKPEKFECCMFDGVIHAHEFPKGMEQRMVVVFTFD
jgi:hypothetical protein